MKVLMVVDEGGCALRIEPEDEEGRALLARFGVEGGFETQLGTPIGAYPSARQFDEVYEGAPAAVV